MRQLDPGDGAHHLVLQLPTAGRDPLEAHAASSLAREIEHRLPEQQGRDGERLRLAFRVTQVDVELQPQDGQCVRRAVVISDGLAAREDVGVGVERRLDSVVHLLLPVVWSRKTGPGSNRVRRRQVEWPERRANLPPGTFVLRRR